AAGTRVPAAPPARPGAVLLAAGGSNQVLAVVLLFCFYLVLSFITIFFNSALTGAVLVRLRGGDPDVATGFAAARSHLGAIAGFAVISATVGVVLYLLEEKFKLLGQIAASLLGGAWGLVTFLVVPVF